MAQRNSTWKWLVTAGLLILAIAGLIWNAAVMTTGARERLDANIAEDARVHLEVQQLSRGNEKAILTLQSDVKYIKQAVDEIRTELKK